MCKTYCVSLLSFFLQVMYVSVVYFILNIIAGNYHMFSGTLQLICSAAVIMPYTSCSLELIELLEHKYKVGKRGCNLTGTS